MAKEGRRIVYGLKFKEFKEFKGFNGKKNNFIRYKYYECI